MGRLRGVRRRRGRDAARGLGEVTSESRGVGSRAPRGIRRATTNASEPDIEEPYNRALRGIARIAVALAATGAALVAAGYRLGPERFWALAFVEYLPYPIHLLPALAAVLLSLALGPLWRVAALLALGLVVWGVMGFELHQGDPRDGRVALRVMTYNIKSHLAAARPGGYDRLAREIASHAPDIVVVQDGAEPSARRQFGPGSIAAIFGERLGYRYSSGQFTIASRHPLRDCAPGVAAPALSSDAWVHCVVDVGATAIDLYDVHLRTPRQGLNAARSDAPGGVDDWEQNVAVRLAQAHDLARALGAATRPVIVGGDLNAPEPSLAVRTLLASGLRDAFSGAGVGFGYTYGHALRPGFSFLRLDHVLVGPKIGVAGCRAGGAAGSEHRPVIADLWIPAGAQG
ncbi:MAG: endonuclease/exonuclease/phosphatase family protein [Caldimonas sp.]